MIESVRLTPLPDLSNPTSFNEWWTQKLASGFTSLELAELLETEGSMMGRVRASLVLGFAPQVRERSRLLAGQALSAQDEVTRLFALCLLAYYEVKDGFHLRHGEFHGAPTAEILIQSVLEQTKNLITRSLLLVEVEARLHRAMSEAKMLTGDFLQAKSHIAHAIALSQGLGLKLFTYYSRLFLANIATNSGLLQDARGQYQVILSDFESPSEVLFDAQLYMAVTLYFSGEDRAAIATLKELSVQFPNNLQAKFYMECFLTLLGWDSFDSEPEVYREYLPNGLATLREVFQLIWKANDRKGNKERERKNHLLKARTILEKLRQHSDLVKSMAALLNGIIALHLNELMLAIKHAKIAINIENLPLASKIMGFSLALEIALRYNGHDIIPIHDLVNQLCDLIDQVSGDARTDLALRIRMLLPRAGAFLAVNMNCPSEFQNICVLSILDVSKRPISVFVQHGLRPTHAIRFSLQAFDFPIIDPNDGGGQLEAEEKVLYRAVEQRKHWFDPVPPALLIYHYLRAHELAVGIPLLHQTSTWHQTAHDIAQRFGILPDYLKGQNVTEASLIVRVLNSMLRGEVSVAGVRRLIRS
jgi:tetratricopeptide (TPR) repeat protein